MKKTEENNVSFKSFLYTVLKISNDVKAVNKGPKATGKRVGRRIYGKATGRLSGNIFK